ncbi:MAG: efflux RND transporter periplasmic adaptor subunit [Myxococcales bacterium]|nr:efflux RND transporter periplasmic adaptor subunit [Myxococcales bacterium]
MTAPDSPPPSPPAAGRRGWFRRRRRSLVAAIVIVGLVGAVVYVRAFAPVSARAYRVESGEVVQQAFGRGTIESDREAQLGFDLVGRVSEVLVDEGDRVSLGQELARLQPDQARADLRTATSGVAAARTSLQRLAAEERKAHTMFDAAEREERRSHELLVKGAIAQHELDIAQDALRIARADLDRVLAQRVEATRSVDVAQGGATQREVTVLRATLLAPFDGLVTRRLREPGDTVAVGTTVLRVVDTDRVFVNAWIDETVLADVHEGQPAQIVRPGSATVPGIVKRVGWEADRQTHELLVEVTPSASLGRVAIGQRADVWITTQTKAAVVRVPAEFLQRDADGTFCDVDRDGRIAVARVQVGLVGRDVVEITRGLQPGDTVLAPTKLGGTLAEGRRWKAP